MHIKKLVEWLLATMLIFGMGLTVNIALAEEAENDSAKEESKESTKKSSDTDKTTENKKDKDDEEDEVSDKDEAENKDDDTSKESDEASDKESDKEGEKKSSENEEEEEESRAQAKSYKNEVRQSESSEDDRNVAVKITETMPFLDVYHNNEIVRIKRIQDKDYKVTNSFARTSRKCPPFCIRPIKLPGDIETVGELEVLEFLKTKVRKQSGLLIDARLKDWHVKGTIPASVSIPFTMFTDDINDINTLQLLELLGAKEDSEGNLDFSEVIDIMLYCNGPWCGQSPRAIKNLLKLGYPSEKMFWYRGGMQAWQSFGLTVITP
ncbi:MAG: rhodanese-like domain-containing protein [bacterium]